MEIRLNLIPPNKKVEIAKNAKLKTAIKTEIAMTIILAGLLVVLFSFKYILNIGLSGEATLTSEIETTGQFGKIKNYDNQFSAANERIKQLAAINQSQLYWSGVFEKISALIPDGITTDALSTDGYTLTISGLSDTRDNLISFKSKLENEKCFSNINLPLSNLVDKSNVAFQIVLDVDVKCLGK